MTDITIQSVPDFLERVFTNKEEGFYHGVADLRVMFRGQANLEWCPLPAAFRTREDFLKEHFYIREYERLMPDKCAGKSGMDILIDAQHYGIPTRLLDITSNALVALFFACGESRSGNESEEERLADGVVIQYAPAPVFMYYDPVFSVYAEYVRRYKDGIHFSDSWKDSLIDDVRNSDGRFSCNAASAVESLMSDRVWPFFILPKYSNDRIASQQGAFLLYTTPLVKKKGSGCRDGVFMFPDEVQYEFEKQINFRYVIPAEVKKDILVQLDSIGVNEARLFPDVEHRAKSIVSTIRKARHMGRVVG
ncbi:FRG domain-containing protein [Bifidobacterium pullorum]|uniref:FRG domain-containing protein n=1 Tax=Bifidobacterium pullorum TaxID=78448 RepID=UPI0025A3E8AB|nr:FRG domain-containing protein [Bifidobacterium pullorum]MDM8323582.1 FRG domain-containing protein [Bifidobacterium pullorum]